MQKVLATDLDGTLIPLNGDPNHASDLQIIGRHIEEQNVTLAFVTGRHFESVQTAITQFNLPVPDYIICDVGSSIFVQRNSPTAAGNEISWSTEPDYVDCLQNKMGNVSFGDFRESLSRFRELRPQEDEKQGRFKLSYYVDASKLQECVELVRQQLRTETVESSQSVFEIISSVDPFNGDGLIDVLPAGVSKAFALRWWLDTINVDSQNAVFSGDSGNDLAAMTAGYRTIIVGNASEELVESVRKSHQKSGWNDRLYVARSNATSGVLEGCRHWGLFQ